MIQVEERGRNLRVLVGDEIEFLIPPQNSRGASTLLIGFLGIISDVFGELSQELQDEATKDMVHVSLGAPVFKDSVNPTEAETARADAEKELFSRIEELRQSEIYEVTQAAFFWQTHGGIDAAKVFAEGGPDAYPKALDALAEASGLGIIAQTVSTGSSSESETGPTVPPDTNIPPLSETLSKLPPEKRSIRQNQKQK